MRRSHRCRRCLLCAASRLRVCVRARASVRRYAPIENMTAVARGNRLPCERRDGIEYAIHGNFLRADPDDVKGIEGCWWCSMEMLVKAVGKADLKPLLEQFEHDLTEARAEAFDDASEESEGEEEGEEGDD